MVAHYRLASLPAARALFHGAGIPFPQGSAASAPLTPGGSGRASGLITFASSGMGETNALLLEMREVGGPAFYGVALPFKKYWTDDLTDTDGDGLANSVEIVLGTNVNEVDTDDDGLEDGWELQGYVWPVDGQLYPAGNLPFRGAQPLRRDVFVDVDYLIFDGKDHKLHIDSIIAIKKLFANTGVPQRPWRTM